MIMTVAHTIISKETIKPSSPTPVHLKTHNLSLVDRFAPNIHMPFVLVYPNYDNADIVNLKKSLSKCLTQYYPFAGRLSKPFESHVDCNDEGIEFIEASQEKRLEEFILKREDHEMTCQLVPNGLGCIFGKSSSNLVEVQLNHFKGGGVALGVSISHKIADGYTMGSFIKQWATISRGGSSVNPYFFSSSTSNNNTKLPEYVLDSKNEVKYVTRLFVFPNSKLNELKKKVSAMGIAPANPTRVEVLTSLIFKCEVDATITTTGLCNPSNLFHLVNMRSKIIKNNPENAAGNIFTTININAENPADIRLNEVVSMLRKEKNELEGIRDIQEVGESFINTVLPRVTGNPNQQVYGSSSLCGFPLYEVDFGWGKPIEVKLVGPNAKDRMFFLMDTPHRDGIVVRVRLPEEEMLYFQEHKELLPYVGNL